MPSGAKKRKAAKKKKEKEANTNPSTNYPEGNDDAKSQDDKGSDGGEVGSPAHQDHHDNHQPFNEGSEELGERDPSSVRTIVVEDTSMEEVVSGVENLQEVGSKDDGVVTIERDLKIEDDSESKISTSSSSSSSDDEYRTVAKKCNKEANHSVSEATSYHDLVKPVDPSSAEVTKNKEIAPAGKTSDAIAEMSPAFDSVKPVVPVSEETINVLESAPIENSVVSNVIKMEKDDEKLFSGAPVTDMEFSAEKVEDKVLLEDNGKASSGVLESASKGIDNELMPPSGGPVAQTSNGTKHIKDPEIPEYSENQDPVDEFRYAFQGQDCKEVESGRQKEMKLDGLRCYLKDSFCKGDEMHQFADE
ncbi:hypothetical protein FNV43_RR05927 [Rhamnella rubrinervis]|uniref:Uncharacterized protein n=1 Tax=Rhamnella rubrinervis TaxID=2594499 RepID=A0A8K0HDJ8_9ROSA|nr:hypothetical protein FNV43_RR05927 [Rhamnella rubrinervis]